MSVFNRFRAKNTRVHTRAEISGHQAAKLLRRKELVPKKGFDLPSFWKPFSINKLATSIEYTRLASFSICSANLTASAASTESHDGGTPDPIDDENSGHQNQFHRRSFVACYQLSTPLIELRQFLVFFLNIFRGVAPSHVHGQHMGMPQTTKREGSFSTHRHPEKPAGLVQLSWRYRARVRDTIPDGPTT